MSAMGRQPRSRSKSLNTSDSQLTSCQRLLVRSVLVTLLVAPSIIYLSKISGLESFFSFGGADGGDKNSRNTQSMVDSEDLATRIQSPLDPDRDKSPFVQPRMPVKTLLSVEQEEGDGAFVRRSIGRPELKQLDPFILLDHFAVAPPAGFPDHPHRGFETVTYMLEGSFTHQDFDGHKGTIGPGDLQWMTAGRGIVHSELPAKHGVQRGIQLWVNLPGKYKMLEPRYQELEHKSVATVETHGVKVSVIAGDSYGVRSPVYTITPIMFLDFSLEPGAVVHQEIPGYWNAFIYVLEGKVQVGSKTASPISSYNTVLLGPGKGLSVWNAENGVCRFLLIGGEPIGEPVVQYGPFVMNTQQEIRKAIQDFRKGHNGFEKAPFWHSSPVHID
ncbi:hypothetical protein R1flu_021024 [Riccia fluitans]|uniref:Pirin n=1 Tax=Riccia fluitans TaxID=41844 RepID=A0ABD1ZQ66_9MARC